MSNISFGNKVIAHLSGYIYNPDEEEFEKRQMNSVEKLYLNNKTLAVISGAGLFLGGIGILAILASMGHLPALVGFLHAGAIPAHTIMIAGASTTAIGGGLALTHAAMLGMRKYGLHAIENDDN